MAAKKTQNVSTKAADEADQTVTLSADEAVHGLGEQHPSTAPVEFTEAVQQHKDAQEEKENLSQGKRIERLERAFQASTGKNIDEF